jgi:hyperosmotically inducible protein
MRIRNRWLSWVLLGLVLAIVPATGFSQGGPPQRGSANYEKWLAQEVRHQLVLLPFLSVFDNLQYSVNGSEVTLAGQVTNSTLKEDAEHAVKGLEGVTKVNNNIQLLPVSPLDDQIRRAEFRAIYGEPSLEKYASGSLLPIHILVMNGHVTLEGTVISQSDKDLINVKANGVPNVFSVTNNLHVEPGK